MALLRETGVTSDEGRLPYPRQNAPVARSIAWKPANDAYYLLAANLRNSGYEHEIYITQRVLLQIQEHAAGIERDVDGSLWGRIFVSPDSGASYAVIADATPGTEAESARTGPQMDGPLRLAGWYCSRHTVATQPAPEDISLYLERCTGGWEPLIVLTNGGQPHDGSLFLVNPMSARSFRAPFRELLEPQLVRENAPKRSCIPWRGYVTDEPVIALPPRERGAARRASAADEPRSTVSIIAEGVAADVRAAARAVGRAIGTGAASRATINIPSSPGARKPPLADAAPPESPASPEPEATLPAAVEPEIEAPSQPIPERNAEAEPVSTPLAPAPFAETSPSVSFRSSPTPEPAAVSGQPVAHPGATAGSRSLEEAPVSTPAMGRLRAPLSPSMAEHASSLLEEHASSLLEPHDVPPPRAIEAPTSNEGPPTRLADAPSWSGEDTSAPAPIRRAILPSDLPHFERRVGPRTPTRRPMKVDEERKVPAAVLFIAAVAALVASLALLGLAVQRLMVARTPVAASQAGMVGGANGDTNPASDEIVAPGELSRSQGRMLVARTDSLRVAMAWYQEMAADHRAGKLGCALVIQARDRLVTTRDSLGSLLATVPDGSRVVEQRRLLVEADRMERQAASRCRPGQR
jgi:hypothetical protein